jgi:hypothetical protein
MLASSRAAWRLAVPAAILASLVNVGAASSALAQSPAHRATTRQAGAAAAPSSSGPTAKPALGKPWSPDGSSTASGSSTTAGATAKPGSKTTANSRTGAVPGRLLVTLAGDTSLTGTAVPAKGKSTAASPARTARTSNATLNSRLHTLGASTFSPLFPTLSAGTVASLTDAARTRLKGDAVDLSRTYVVQVAEQDSARAARTLAGTSGVAEVEPERYVSTMNTGAKPLPAAAVKSAAHGGDAHAEQKAPGTAAALPSNYGLASSAQAYLNAQGVDAVGAYDTLSGRYGKLPGSGETITNVSIGDLTDQSMADDGDAYVQDNGPTTVLRDGRRYLDLPSMPLIPTYVAGSDGTLSASGSTEDQDPSLDEVLLDFGVMAPLPHDRQRAGRTGSGYSDLLGIAPGAGYRLVVPQQPTNDQIAGALLAAATQQPRPAVITASLGFGTDSAGFPGRYLEDDPVNAAVIAAIVQLYHEVVSVSSNDGTRLATPTAVGPDGGSTPTDTTTSPASATSIDDDAYSTTPTKVIDSGAITAGGTTLDDTLAVPRGSSGPLAATGTLAETRTDGGGDFSSGFGTRVDVSAPSDNILVYSHAVGGGAQDVQPVLNGGTSASAPEIAAAAAVVLQAGRIGGHRLSPAAVRSLLERTGRAVTTPPQIDRNLQVGPQVDVTAAVDAELGRGAGGHTAIARLSVAHRVTAGGLGGSFQEDTDQSRIDLGYVPGGGDGEGLTGPVTFGADLTGPPVAHADYVLAVRGANGGPGRDFHASVPAVRVTPRQLLDAAGLPVASSADRQVAVTFQVRSGGRVRASASRVMTVGPSDGTYVEATAPVVDPVVEAGRPVTVHYDLTGVIGAKEPQLLISTVGHWNPVLGPIFTAAAAVPITTGSGTVTVPAADFSGGGGLYGVGVAQFTDDGDLARATFGEFTSVRVTGGTAAQRPDAPTLAGVGSETGGPSGPGSYGHTAEVTPAAPDVDVRYDVRGVRGATSAEVEVSAPGPTLWGSYNTFTNADGTVTDHDGVDAPSTATRSAAGTHGTLRLDSAALGLSGAMAYNVRVLATDRHGKVVGQASPSSQLDVDDGIAPDGSTVTGFAAAGDDSLAVLRTTAGGSQVRHYSTGTGNYGAVLAEDTSTDAAYQVFGTDPGAHRALLGHLTASGDTRLETYDTGSGSLVAAVTVATGDGQVVAGRVDPSRHRAAILLHTPGGDTVLPVDLATGAAGEAVNADPTYITPDSLDTLDVDASTGAVYVADNATADICLYGGSQVRVDLDTGVAAIVSSAWGCGVTSVSDQAGGLYTLVTNVASRNIRPTTAVSGTDGKGQQAGPWTIRAGTSLTMAVDGVHHLALVAFASPAGETRVGSTAGFLFDNNSTSQIEVVDLTDGKVLRTLSGFNFTAGFGGDVTPATQRSIQLDPATRTGWTYGPYGAQIARFTY